MGLVFRNLLIADSGKGQCRGDGAMLRALPSFSRLASTCSMSSPNRLALAFREHWPAGASGLVAEAIQPPGPPTPKGETQFNPPGRLPKKQTVLTVGDELDVDLDRDGLARSGRTCSRSSRNSSSQIRCFPARHPGHAAGPRTTST